MPCLLGTCTERTGMQDLQEFRTDLGREFFSDPNSPRILFCDLRRGLEAIAFLRLFRRSGGKPPYTFATSDPDSFECLVRRTRPTLL